MDRTQDWQTMIDVAIAQAQAGDEKARAWLGRYVLPDPDLRRLAGVPEQSLADVLDGIAEQAQKGSKTVD